MKSFIENYTFRFSIDNKNYMLTVDDESCEYGCTFSAILRDSLNLNDLKRRLVERNLKYHLYEIKAINTKEKENVKN